MVLIASPHQTLSITTQNLSNFFNGRREILNQQQAATEAEIAVALMMRRRQRQWVLSYVQPIL